MKCPKCGAELPKNAEACPKCGARVGKKKLSKGATILITIVLIALVAAAFGYLIYRHNQATKPADPTSTSAVGQDGAVPVHEPLKSAEPFYDFVSGAEMKMIGVAQFDLTLKSLQIIGGESAFDGRRCRDVHKSRHLDRTVNGLKAAASRGAAFQFESVHKRPPG